MRRTLLPIVALGFALAVVAPASAHHELTLVHKPPATAIQGSDLVLPVGTYSTCAPVCSGVEVTLHYLDSDGVAQSQAVMTPDFAPAGAVAFTVPGKLVSGASFSYWFEAEQWWAIFNFDGHTAKARSPELGVFTVLTMTP